MLARRIVRRLDGDLEAAARQGAEVLASRGPRIRGRYSTRLAVGAALMFAWTFPTGLFVLLMMSAALSHVPVHGPDGLMWSGDAPVSDVEMALWGVGCFALLGWTGIRGALVHLRQARAAVESATPGWMRQPGPGHTDEVRDFIHAAASLDPAAVTDMLLLDGRSMPTIRAMESVVDAGSMTDTQVPLPDALSQAFRRATRLAREQAPRLPLDVESVMAAYASAAATMSYEAYLSTPASAEPPQEVSDHCGPSWGQVVAQAPALAPRASAA